MESNVYKALELLLRQSEFSQRKFFHRNNHNGNTVSGGSHLLAEWCTVGIRCARRSGHTTAIFQIIDNYFSGESIIYCGHNMSQSIMMRQDWDRDFNNPNVDLKFATISNLNNSLRDLKSIPVAVFLDCASIVDIEEKKALSIVESLASRVVFEKKEPFFYVKVQ